MPTLLVTQEQIDEMLAKLGVSYDDYRVRCKADLENTLQYDKLQCEMLSAIVITMRLLNEKSTGNKSPDHELLTELTHGYTHYLAESAKVRLNELYLLLRLADHYDDQGAMNRIVKNYAYWRNTIAFLRGQEPVLDKVYGVYSLDDMLHKLDEVKLYSTGNMPPIDESQIADKPGYVYFLKDSMTGLIKVGRSRNVKQRKSEIDTSSPTKTTLLHEIYCRDCHLAEKHFHNFFAAKHRRGEWFALTDRDMEAIKQILTL